MAVAAKRSGRHTLEDLLAIPEQERFHEVLDGELVRKAMPSAKHGSTQLATSQLLRPYNRRPGGKGGPGGWWFAAETEVALAPDQIFRPDVAGWRRERLPELPAEGPVAVRPDWVCEILSPSHVRNDTVRKLRAYHHHQIPHYWIIDPVEETLTVHRFTEGGYLLVLAAERGERVRAEPFDAIDLQVGVLFGDDEEDA
ncbi:MAG: Uma2 family endonuclease [Myxococcales bacterium]|nr:Uma2 family endonuclease [Myxococcales bacterium]